MFMPVEEFQDRVAKQLDEVKAGELMVRVSDIIVPGERGFRRR